MRILLIDHDFFILRSLQLCLKAHCFAVDIAENGRKGLHLGCTNDYDLIITEAFLPQIDGTEICVTLRDRKRNMPILVLSHCKDIDRKITLLNAGADDYLTKPFSRFELIARIQALLRRPKDLQKEKYCLGNLELDIQKMTVTRDGKQIYLTRKEFSLLAFLLKNKGSVVARGMIMEHVWDRYLDPFSNTIETHMVNLRKKIDRQFRPKLLHTIPGQGYKIDYSK